uniref:Tyrosine-protein phosphatase domain-containing protein n=1 Tax=Panagrolaimus sp. PS1159 TaxID=55785 RepID=A0AC35GWS4_9BILA
MSTKRSSTAKSEMTSDIGSTCAKKPKNKKKESQNDTEAPSICTKNEKTTNRNDTNAFSEEAKVAMKQFTYQIVQSGLHQLRVQYSDLKSFVPADPSKKHFDANQAKCRYKDVPCWDRTRVVLSWPPGVAGDFVHANRVTHEFVDGQQYICCQGPLDATVSDFWRCVWQEKVKQIIMLCRCEEMGKAKCAQYWPATVGEKMTFHGLTIKCEKVDSSDRSFVHTKLALTYGNETRMIDHRQWTTWPDKSVPKTPMAPFRLLQYTRKNPSHSTIIVSIY